MFNQELIEMLINVKFKTTHLAFLNGFKRMFFLNVTKKLHF